MGYSPWGSNESDTTGRLNHHNHYFLDLSSLARDRTCIPCIARCILNHWTTREALPIACFYK